MGLLHASIAYELPARLAFAGMVLTCSTARVYAAAMLPITDEQAKAIQDVAKLGDHSLETIKAFFGYLGGIFGTVPQDFVALTFGDALHFKRIENLLGLFAKTRERLETLRVEEPAQVPLSLGRPLLEAASEESREELVDLWAKLLTAAMNPATTARVRYEFTETIRKLNPLDASVLQLLRRVLPQNPSPTAQAFLAGQLSVSPDQIEVSFLKLIELGCLADPDPPPERSSGGARSSGHVILTAYGREFLSVVGG